MSLQSIAQEFIVVDQAALADQAALSAPLEIIEVEPLSGGSEDSNIEVHEPVEIEIVVDELPGAPTGTKDPEPEPTLEVSEEDNKVDDNDAKKNKKNEKWDWESKGPHGFVTWIKERVTDVPSHSGYDSAGLERAMAYLDRLDNEISRAMRLDLDGQLDANKIEEVRAKIDDGIARLQGRLDKVKKTKKSNRKKKSEIEMASLVKEAQKITGVQGIYIVAPLLISRIARVCINGMVSAGHDIEYIYKQQIEKYKLNDREQAEVMQLLADMGYPLRQDRGYMPDEDMSFSSSDNFDFSASYKA